MGGWTGAPSTIGVVQAASPADDRAPRGETTRVRDEVHAARWLSLAAVVTWLVCGLSPLARAAQGEGPPFAAAIFFGAYAFFGAALLGILYLQGRPGPPHAASALLLIESVAGMTLIYVSGRYFGGTGATSATLVIVAAQAPYIVRPYASWVLVGLQTIVVTLMFWADADLADILSLGLAIGGFQAFATGSSFLALRELMARSKLARAHDELRAAQARLADSSRVEERLRISRDLHDTLGHHLTALSLQLDVASRLTDGKAADHVRQAHAITRLLLADVRDVVSALRDTRPIDLAAEIRSLAESPSSLAIHLTMPAALDVSDTERAQALLRCVQEIITNAARHAHARNLWIGIEAHAGGVALHARDDGRGAAQLTLGHGLTGMRERFAALAGSVEFESRPETGFEVRGFMPLAHPAT
jgi:signal transduction histidine kinase